MVLTSSSFTAVGSMRWCLGPSLAGVFEGAVDRLRARGPIGCIGVARMHSKRGGGETGEGGGWISMIVSESSTAPSSRMR